MKRAEVILMVLQVPIDYILLLSAAISAYAFRFSEWAVALKPVVFDLSLGEFILLSSIVAVVWLFIFAIAGLYSTDPNKKFADDLVRVLLACSAGLAVIAVYILFTQQQFDSRFLVAGAYILAVLYVIIGRFIMRGIKALLYRAGIGLRRVVLIGVDDMLHHVEETLRQRPELGYRVIATYDNFNINVEKTLVAMYIDELLFMNPRAHEKETLSALNFCNVYHVVFKYSADLFATYSSNMVVTALAGVPIVELKKTPLDGWGRVAKRTFDIICSSAMIILTSSFMIVSAIIILFETGRPIIYKNERVGLRGRHFFTLKFRSMYQKDSTGLQFGDAGKKAEQREKTLIKKQNSRTGPIYKIANDPRVTVFGRFIRRWSIDELPQFFNVLGGSMSIVGPRPHQPREVDMYKTTHPKIFALKPGITGLAQISGRSDLSFEDEMKLDILYIERWSLLQDIIIFLKTPFVLLKKRKAE